MNSWNYLSACEGAQVALWRAHWRVTEASGQQPWVLFYLRPVPGVDPPSLMESPSQMLCAPEMSAQPNRTKFLTHQSMSKIKLLFEAAKFELLCSNR